MLDLPTHNLPFADKRDKVGMDGVPKEPHFQENATLSLHENYKSKPTLPSPKSVQLIAITSTNSKKFYCNSEISKKDMASKT